MAKPTRFTERRQLQLEPEMVEAINDIRFEKRINTEAEAFRHVISAGLKALGK